MPNIPEILHIARVIRMHVGEESDFRFEVTMTDGQRVIATADRLLSFEDFRVDVMRDLGKILSRRDLVSWIDEIRWPLAEEQ
jgi:hypothetical protein